MFNWKVRYFYKKLRGVECTIADLEFKRFKTREIREEVRQVYDTCKAKLLSVETTIAQQKESKTMPEDDVKRLDDEVVRMKRDIERYESQMKALDLEVDGSKPTNEYPEGVNGITQQIDALRELHGMLKDYIGRL